MRLNIATASNVTLYSYDAKFGRCVFDETSSDLELYSYAGSTAEAYASENGHTFVAIPEISDSIIAAPEGITVIVPDGGWTEGTNTFTVATETVCVVLVSHDGGETYSKLNAIKKSDGSYSFTATDVTADTTITVAVKGDVNGDGEITNADVTGLKCAVLGKTSIDTLTSLICDSNGDGKISNADCTVNEGCIFTEDKIWLVTERIKEMKKLYVGFFAILFIVCICSSAVIPALATNENNTKGVIFTATLDKTSLELSDKEQTVVLSFGANSAITLDGIGFKIVCDAPITLKAIEGNGGSISFSGSDYNLATGVVGWSTPDAENLSGVTDIASITFSVPANIDAGEYNVGIVSVEVTSDYGSIWENGASAMAVITVGSQSSAEDTTAKPEDTTATPEDTTAKSEDTTATPEDTTAKSEDTTATPEDTTDKSEDTTANPEDTTAKSEDTTANPEDTTAKSEDTTANPDDTPTEPEKTPLPFTDVAEKDWFYSSVEYAYTNKIMQGTGAAEFAPNVSTSRAMLVTMLWRLEGSPSLERTNKFTDVADDAWYSSPVEWAYKNQLVLGYNETTFAPDDPITREQMVSILWRYAKYKEIDVSVPDSVTLDAFADEDSIQSYAVAPMRWAFMEKLVQGVDSTNLAPGQTATRAQVATVLMRFIENIK